MEKQIGALPVSIDLKDVPLRMCLALVLAQLEGDLDGRLIDGLLVIGSRQWLQSLANQAGNPVGGSGATRYGGFQ